jgi:hypothetical protein
MIIIKHLVVWKIVDHVWEIADHKKLSLAGMSKLH